MSNEDERGGNRVRGREGKGERGNGATGAERAVLLTL